MSQRLPALAFLSLAACGGANPPETTRPPTKAEISPGAGAPCEQKIARMCGEGLVDSCSLSLTTHHACVDAGAKAGPDCLAKILLKCPAGQVDACNASPPISSNHICVIP